MPLSEDDKRTIKRLRELAERAEKRGAPAYSEFLTLAEQALTPQAQCDSLALAGGWPGAERRLACFGEGAEAAAPIVCLRIAPLSPKFAEELGHRDFLGALMSLGLRREVLGDILLCGGSAYLFCLDSVEAFVKAELTKIRHTAVKCEAVAGPPEDALPEPEDRELVVSSVRLDSLISAVWSLSRAEGQEHVAQGRAFINGRETQTASAVPAEGDIISVRGLGRFKYCGVARETKKGRLRAAVKVY